MSGLVGVCNIRLKWEFPKIRGALFSEDVSRRVQLPEASTIFLMEQLGLQPRPLGGSRK